MDIRSDLYHQSILPPFHGVLVRIMTKYDPGDVTGSILIQGGAWTKINIHPRHYKLINMESGKVKQMCIEEGNTVDYKIVNYSSYSVFSCKLDCAQNVSLKYCSCVLPLELKFLKEAYHSVTCNFVKLNQCFYQNVMKIHTNEIVSCSEKCVAKCDYWEYTKTMSAINFNSANFES